MVCSPNYPQGFPDMARDSRVRELHDSGEESGSEVADFSSGRKVLVVEEVESGGVEWEEISQSLRTCGYQVKILTKLKCARQLCENSKDKYDVMLVGGKTVLRNQQAIADLSKQIPIVLLASHESPAETITAINLGVVEVMSRPYEVSKLRNIWQHTVRRLMKEQGMEPGPIHGQNGETFILWGKPHFDATTDAQHGQVKRKGENASEKLSASTSNSCHTDVSAGCRSRKRRMSWKNTANADTKGMMVHSYLHNQEVQFAQRAMVEQWSESGTPSNPCGTVRTGQTNAMLPKSDSFLNFLQVALPTE
mmetsp:Transcript_2541/g.5991  ORF Transcript_2541/g.5991 Transcript_2541/m.5991 type:complete len:307 (-) Transcript_2541:1074-1994(-)